MGDKTIAIVGITGNQEQGWKVRGITRDPSKASAKAWADRGVQMVSGDLDDVESMKKALENANVIFGNTDFVQHMADPVIVNQAKAQGRGVNELANERELEQAKKLMDAIAPNINSLELFIFSAFSDAKGWSGGTITYNLHFDTKWAAIEYLKASYPNVWKKTSLLQMTLFMSNWKIPFRIPQRQSDGTFKVRLPMRADLVLPMVDANSDTGYFVKALLQLPPNTNLMGASQLTTWNEWCQIWSKINNRECTFESSDPKELEDLLGPFGKELVASFDYIEEFGNSGGDPTAVYPWDLDVQIQRTTLEEYLRRQDWSEVLQS